MNLSSRDYKGILDITETAYSVPARAEMFRAVCEKLGVLLPFDGAVFLPLDPSSNSFCPKGHVVFNSPSKTLPLFCQKYAVLHPLFRIGVYDRRVNQAMRITDKILTSRLAETEYCREFQSMIPMFYELDAMASAQGGPIGAICLHRTSRSPDFTERDREMLTLLMPHLSRAIHNIDIIKAITSNVKVGVITVGADGHLHSMNDDAREALRSSPLSAIPDPELSGEPTFFQSEAGGYRVRAARIGPGRKEKVIILEPLAEAHHLRSKLLAFGLTPRQQEIGVLVIKGYSNREISERLFITEQTVKDHLRAIFAKARVRRRSELMAKVFGLPAPPTNRINE